MEQLISLQALRAPNPVNTLILNSIIHNDVVIKFYGLIHPAGIILL